jgi:hypothetical protein
MRKHFEENAGLYGWGVVAGTVIALDIALPQTLSSAADKLLEHPQMKYVAWAIGGLVTGHVYNIIPEQYDPIAKAADYVAERWL